ncbi:unnamed protein product, partial [Ectocarpus fasciculatus]
QATKYLPRAGQISKAEQTIAIFTRHEGDPEHNLFEMQSRCAVLGAAAVNGPRLRSAPVSRALAVHTHFEDFVEDQFDFHTHCMRKVRCRSIAESLS